MREITEILMQQLEKLALKQSFLVVTLIHYKMYLTLSIEAFKQCMPGRMYFSPTTWLCGPSQARVGGQRGCFPIEKAQNILSTRMASHVASVSEMLEYTCTLILVLSYDFSINGVFIIIIMYYIEWIYPTFPCIKHQIFRRGRGWGKGRGGGEVVGRGGGVCWVRGEILFYFIFHFLFIYAIQPI